jgi:hypothetical protein
MEANRRIVTYEVKYIKLNCRLKVCSFTATSMKTLDWSVETLCLDYNSTGLCIHLYKPEEASENMINCRLYAPVNSHRVSSFLS